MAASSIAKRCLLFSVLVIATSRGNLSAVEPPPDLPVFTITVVDRATGKPVPMMELGLTHQQKLWTDSFGRVAFYKPELMGKNVWFYVRGYGYSHPYGGFDYRGLTLRPVAGGSATIRVDREFLPQRVGRLTGVGIDDHSVMAGFETPARQDDSPFPVVAHRSVSNALFDGRYYWFWDAARTSEHPDGEDFTICATSPDGGGFDTNAGVALAYFRDAAGRPKNLLNVAHDGPSRMSSPRMARDRFGREHLIVNYELTDTAGKVSERGLAEYDALTSVFAPAIVFAPDFEMSQARQGLGFRQSTTGEHFHHGFPVPRFRTPSLWESLLNPVTYEALSCLTDGSTFNGSADQLERGQDGNLVWAWRRGTSPVGDEELKTLRNRGAIATDEVFYRMTDADTGATLLPDSGSINYNPYRQRWVMIATEKDASSRRGEVWYLEGDTHLGPWVYGRRLMSFRRYLTNGRTNTGEPMYEEAANSFIDPFHHPEWDAEGGRIIYFEGTLTRAPINNRHAIPQYNDNQLLYRLDLSDARCLVPVPVYERVAGARIYRTKLALGALAERDRVAWFTCDRPFTGGIPIYSYRDASNQSPLLTSNGSLGFPPYTEKTIAFHAFAPNEDTSGNAAIVPLYEFIDSDSGQRVYSTEATLGQSGYVRRVEPVCRVWDYPLRVQPHQIRSTSPSTGVGDWEWYGSSIQAGIDDGGALP